MKKQALISVLIMLLAGGASVSVRAQAVAVPATSTSGFYGGVALRDGGADMPSVGIRQPSSLWGKFASPTTDDAGSRTLLVGGYRWQNEISLEASLATSDRYSLRPRDAVTRSGVGLSLEAPAEGVTHSMQADIYTSWTPRRSLSLYSRLGYAQNDVGSSVLAFSTPSSDPRRLREGVNYGVGFRYDLTTALGLRLEYARFGRFAGEAATSGGIMPDSDQVQLGLQLRF